MKKKSLFFSILCSFILFNSNAMDQSYFETQHNFKDNHGIERLDILCCKKILSDGELCRKLSNSNKNYFNNDDKLSIGLQEIFRKQFSKENSIMSNALKIAVKKNSISIPGSCNADGIAYYPEKSSIIINGYKTIIITKLSRGSGGLYDDEYETFPTTYLIDLRGNVKKTLYGHVDLSALPNQNLSSTVIRNLSEHYGIQLKNQVIKVSTDEVLSSNGSNISNIELYNFSRSNKLNDFTNSRIPLKQIFLLTAIDQAKKQNRDLLLTKKEQEIFNGLLPEIKNVAKAHVIFYNASVSSLKFWNMILRDIFLKQDSKFRVLSYEE